MLEFGSFQLVPKRRFAGDPAGSAVLTVNGNFTGGFPGVYLFFSGITSAAAGWWRIVPAVPAGAADSSGDGKNGLPSRKLAVYADPDAVYRGRRAGDLYPPRRRNLGTGRNLLLDVPNMMSRVLPMSFAQKWNYAVNRSLRCWMSG